MFIRLCVWPCVCGLVCVRPCVCVFGFVCVALCVWPCVCGLVNMSPKVQRSNLIKIIGGVERSFNLETFLGLLQKHRTPLVAEAR